MDNKTIRTFLEDIYQLDPSLKQRETELIEIVRKMLELKPDIQLDRRFVRQLRTRLAKESKEHYAPERASTIFNFSSMNKITYVVSGSIAVLVIAFGIVYFSAPPGQQQELFTTQAYFEKVADNAFGVLSDQAGKGAANPGVAESAAAPTAQMAFGRGGGGGMVAMDASESKMAPEPWSVTEFEYVYQGESVEFSDSKLPVYKRQVRSNSISSSINSLLGLGLVDLSKRSSIAYQNISVYDEQSNTHISVNFDSGMISLYRNQNIELYAAPYRELTTSDLVPDEQLFAIADAYIKEMGIQLDGYGEPELVDTYAKILAYQASDMPAYIPEYMNVLYPLSINGEEVYDQGGNKDGVMIMVSLRTKSVMSVSNLSIQQYQQSNYQIETDINTIIANQNFHYEYPPEAQVTTVNVGLGTPEQVLVKIYQYDGNRENIVFVPALKFPVMAKPENNPYYPDYIVAPMVKEFMNNQNGGIMRAMPVPAAAGGAVEEMGINQTEPATPPVEDK